MTERVKRPISWLAMSFRAAEERIEPVNSRTQYGSASRRCSASSRASRGSSGMYQSWTKIGRASCRERVSDPEAAGAVAEGGTGNRTTTTREEQGAGGEDKHHKAMMENGKRVSE